MRPLYFSLLISTLFAQPAFAQKAPEVGYVYPPGAKAGSTIDVKMGGYDWTPDLQYFVHEPKVKLDITGPAGPILVTPPPYWFGYKGYAPPPAMPREVPAKLTLPADLPPGPIRWQVANASGASATGIFYVGEYPDVRENERARTTQALPSLPVTVSGRVDRIEDVDRYRLKVEKDGPVSLESFARRLGSPISLMLQIRDDRGQMMADVADTAAQDAALTFAAKAGVEYTLSVYDLDFRGDWSYVYRIDVVAGPRVLAAFPASLEAGKAQEVEFRGIGVATGKPVLESVRKSLTAPNTPGSTLSYRLETPHGTSLTFKLPISALSEAVAAEGPGTLSLPGGITGVLARRGEVDSFTVALKKDQAWRFNLAARSLGSPLDVSLAVLGPDGKEAARSDDLPDTTDAGVNFAAPADGTYTLVVESMSGVPEGSVPSYRLSGESLAPGFRLRTPGFVNAPIGGQAELTVAATREGGYNGPIAIRAEGLPAGVTLPDNAAIPMGQGEAKIAVKVAADAASIAGMVRVIGTADVGGTMKSVAASVTAAGNLSPRSPEDLSTDKLLLATTIKPLWKVEVVDKDGGRTVHRGTTYPAELTVKRTEGYTGELTLMMASKQSYLRQGIRGPDMVVPPGADRAWYPCFMPEWLDTLRTSRMIVVVVGKIADPKGNVRYVLSDSEGRITMSLEGALLKISHSLEEVTLAPGASLEVPVRVGRSAKLPEAARLELVIPDELAGMVSADPVEVAASQETAVLKIRTTANPELLGDQKLMIRATAMQNGKYAVVSETALPIRFK